MVKERVHTRPIQQKSQPFFQKKAQTSPSETVDGKEEKQKKIKVSKQGDPYEREADKVADQVVKKQDPEQVNPPLANSISPLVQRKGEEDLAQRVPQEEYRGTSEASIQKKGQKKPEPDSQTKAQESQKPVSKKDSSPIQKKAKENESEKKSPSSSKKQIQKKEDPKGKASPPQSKEKVQKKEAPMAQEKSLAKKEEAPKPFTPEAKQKVQKKEKPEEGEKSAVQAKKNEGQETSSKEKVASKKEEVQKREEEKPIQRKAAPTERKGEEQTLSRVEEMLQASKGKGQPLPESLRQELEVLFGVDFSQVRIHTGGNAEYLSQALKAQAFAHGKDIYFNTGKFSPNSLRGKHLLAHELTHTVQQGAAIPLPTSSQRQTNRHASSPITQHTVQGDWSFPDIDLPDIELPEINLDAVREKINDIAERNVPGLSLFFLHIRYNPILGRTVQYSDRALLQAVFRLVPTFGDLLFQRLDKKGIINDAIAWVNERLEAKDLTRTRIENVFDAAWDAMDFVPTPINPFTIASNNIDVLEREFGPLLRDILAFATEAGAEILVMIKEAFLEALSELAREIQGYDVLADLLGEDPISGEERNASTADILRSILSLPLVQALGGDKLLPKLEEHNKIEETADWIDQQWGILQNSFSQLVDIATTFLEGFSMETLRDPMGFVNDIKDDVMGFVDTITEFFGNLADKALELIKELSLWLLDTFIGEESPYWDLIVFVFGRNPVTGEEVPRDYLRLIGAFLKLLPNGDSLYEKFIATGALQNMVDWVSNAVTEFITIIGGIKDAIVELFTTSTIEDLFEPIPFFQRIFNLFQEPVTKLLAFVKKVVIKLFEVLMDIMNIPQDVVVQIINNVISAVEDIKRDPVQFLLNLLKAVKEGFSQFFNNILTHLFNGVTDWLFGTLTEAGVTIPQTFDLPSILTMVLEILGLTMDNIWERLALKIGEERVNMIRGAIDRLTGIWNFIQRVREEGISAIWDYIKEQVSNFWTMILDSAKEWIITTIIQKVTVKLLSMLDPTGVMAVVNGFIAFYNAIQSFVEKLNEMLQIAASFTRGVAEIAKGAVTSAANFLENALAEAIPVAISFLANQVGLGGISDKIREVIQMVRDYINQGIDWLLDKAIQAIQSIASIFTGGGGDGDTEDADGNTVDPTDHAAVADRAKSDMEAPPEEASTYEEVRAAKETQSRSVERHYTDMLELGIAMTITFPEAAQDKGDNDLDFHIRIAPNNHDTDGKVDTDQEGSLSGPNFSFEAGVLTMDDGEEFREGSEIVIKSTKEPGVTQIFTSQGRFQWAKPKPILAFQIIDVQGQKILQVEVDDRKVTPNGYYQDWAPKKDDLVPLTDERLIEENDKEVWDSFETAKFVLNFRVRGIQNINPPGKQWEHIAERTANSGNPLVNSNNNLALTSSSINQRLNSYYNEPRDIIEHQLQVGSTERISIREFLVGKSFQEHQRYKKEVYSRPDFNVSLRWVDSTIPTCEGKQYQVLE